MKFLNIVFFKFILILLMTFLFVTTIYNNLKIEDNILNDKTEYSQVSIEKISDPTIMPVEQTPEPAAYQEIAEIITQEEIEILARLLYLEAGNQSIDGQRTVIEVVFNRVLSDEFPNTIKEVVYAKNQFSPAHLIPYTTPTEQ